MADNIVTTGFGGTQVNVRTKDRSSVHTQIVGLDLNPAGAETLMAGRIPVLVQYDVGGTPTPVTETDGLPAIINALNSDDDSVTAVLEGLTPSKYISAASTNLTSVQATPCHVGFIYAYNLNAADRYLKLYNKASAPVIASDAALLLQTYPIPHGSGFIFGPTSGGLTFTTGLAFALTTGIGDTDANPVAANEIVVNFGRR